MFWNFITSEILKSEFPSIFGGVRNNLFLMMNSTFWMTNLRSNKYIFILSDQWLSYLIRLFFFFLTILKHCTYFHVQLLGFSVHHKPRPGLELVSVELDRDPGPFGRRSTNWATALQLPLWDFDFFKEIPTSWFPKEKFYCIGTGTYNSNLPSS